MSAELPREFFLFGSARCLCYFELLRRGWGASRGYLLRGTDWVDMTFASWLNIVVWDKSLAFYSEI